MRETFAFHRNKQPFLLSSVATRPWFFLGAALLDRIPYYRQTHNDYMYRQSI